MPAASVDDSVLRLNHRYCKEKVVQKVEEEMELLAAGQVLNHKHLAYNDARDLSGHHDRLRACVRFASIY